jgi:hypothetical protein
MQLKLFHDNPTCTTRVNCGPCRARTPKGVKLRKAWAERFAGFDPAAPCPFGLPWDYVRSKKSTPPQPPHTAHVIAFRQHRCNGCEHQLGWESPDQLKVYCARIPKETCARGCLSLVRGRCSEWLSGEPPSPPPASSFPSPAP